MTATDWISGIKACLAPLADAEAAPIMQAYMKDIAPFLGIKTETRRAAVKAFWKMKGLPEQTLWKNIVLGLYALPEREYHYVALELLQSLKRKWVGDELPLFEQLIVSKSWWDTVDVIATKLVAEYFLRFPAARDATVDRWNKSSDMWLRRVSIIFQNPYKTKTDQALLFRCINACAHEPDFFIRKAIGWALRDYSKSNPQAVRSFVDRTILSPLSRKEALRHL